MNLKTFKSLTENVFEDLITLMEKKNSQYATPDNIFHNFREGANYLKISKEKYVLALKMKHELAIYEMVEQERYEIGEFKERIFDVILYYLILYAMIVDRHSEEY